MEKKAEVTNWKQKIRKQRKENISLTNLNTGNIGISDFWILGVLGFWHSGMHKTCLILCINLDFFYKLKINHYLCTI